jgi:hypothetical protein
MLDAARRRAPTARFVDGDALEADVGTGYDRVVLSFVLHGFDAPGRARLLVRSAAALVPGGRVGVLDWALPAGRARARLWRGFLRTLEPEPGPTMAILDGALSAEVPAAGLRVTRRGRRAGGRVQLLVAEPSAP